MIKIVKDDIFCTEYIFNTIIVCGIYAAVVIFPFMNLVTISLSHMADLRQGLQLFPRKPTLEAYIAIFKNTDMLVRPFLNSVYVTVSGVVIALVMQVIFAYVLAKKDLKGLKYIMIPFSNYVFLQRENAFLCFCVSAFLVKLDILLI